MYEQLKEVLSEEQIKIQEPLSKHTTLQVGGLADFFVMPKTAKEIKEVIFLCKEQNCPYEIIGNGSNLLVSDEGFPGVIIQIGKWFSEIQIKENEKGCLVRAQSGIMLAKLAMTIANHGLTGFEFAAGIPGMLGGAIAMNAGAYGGEIKDCIVSAEVLNQAGEIQVLSKDELNLSYRMSQIQIDKLVVLSATFEFLYGEKQLILYKIQKFNEARKEKQPLDYPSAGSTFKRPKQNYAGQLIMDCGLRGYRVGNMAISEKHCGFVINLGNGTAKQTYDLIQDVIRIVYETHSILLEPEVKMIGSF